MANVSSSSVQPVSIGGGNDEDTNLQTADDGADTDNAGDHSEAIAIGKFLTRLLSELLMHMQFAGLCNADMDCLPTFKRLYE